MPRNRRRPQLGIGAFRDSETGNARLRKARY